ncbi:MAG TPA: hypothetical protein VGX48_24420 [Pyrinomonadaceae bacterium]|jgi:hypothetical protein|nr:hypothetical protein [Pyrinomonadaceae bacterium]
MKIICLLLPLLLANLPQQTTKPDTQWSLAARLILNTVHAIDYELKELTDEFPVLRGDEHDWEATDCAQAKEVELTFELPGGERPPKRPGLLQEFRVIE